MSDSTLTAPQAVTRLSEDEQLFATASTTSPTAKCARSSARWTSTAQIARGAAAQAVRPGRHGHRDPRAVRRRRRHASSTRCWPSRRCRGSTRRSACWSTCRTRWSSTRCCAGATRDLKQRYLPRLAADTVGAYCLSEAGSGIDAFALTTRAVDDGDAFVLSGRKLWITNANEADLFIVFATVESRGRLQGHHRVPGRARHAGLHRRQEGRQARHPRQQHLRAAVRRLPRAQGQRARRGRQGLQGRDRDAERRPHRHRRADARPGPGRLRPRGRLRQGAPAVRQADRRVPGRAVPARADGLRRRGRPRC